MSLNEWRVKAAQTSLARRVALASAVFGLIVVAVATASAYWALSRQLEQRAATELEGQRALIEHVLSSLPGIPAPGVNLHQIGDLLIGQDGLHVAVLGSEGCVLSVSSTIAQESVSRIAGGGTDDMGPAGRMVRWQSTSGRRYASLASTATARDGGALRFVVSEELSADERLLSGFARAGLLGIPLVIFLITLGPWLVARSGLLPLHRFTRLSSSVTSRTLGQRFATERLPAELRVLAHDLNAMLARLDESVTRLAEFSADLAHEMRTPLATLLGRTQVALSKSRSVDELRDTLVGNSEELERLSGLVSDMLFLARGEPPSNAHKTTVALGGEARRVADFLSLAAEEQNITIAVVGEATVYADAGLVQRALMNLVSNAIRHAQASSEIRIAIAIAAKRDDVALTVSNRGVPVPADQLERIFDRFVRLDSARSRSQGGSGLGLAIVKSIMNAHGGSVSAVSEAGWTSFTLVFPVAVPPVPGTGAPGRGIHLGAG